MKRSELVDKLIKEGMSEKTLVNFTDKQLNNLAERMIGEQVTTVPGKPSYKVGENGGSLPPADKGYKITKDPIDKSIIAQPVSEVKEELKGKQKNIDKNHNGKIDGQDFEILNKEKKGEVKEGMFGGKHKKGETIKHDGHEIDVFSKGDEKVYGHPRKEGSKNQNDKERLVYSDLDSLKKSIGSMSKGEKNVNFPKSKKISNPDYKATVVDINEVDMGLTIKGSKSSSSSVFGASPKTDKKDKEVKEWVESLAENNYHSFTSKNEIMELINIKLNESEVHQYGPNVKTGHNGLPEFMTYEAIVGSGPKIAPSKPKVDPGTKPVKPKTPFQPGPKVNPNPKALGEDNPKIAPSKPKVDPGTKPSKPKTPFQPGPKVNPNIKATIKGDKK